MKRVLSILSVITALCILLSCIGAGITAASAEPQPPFYLHYPVDMIVAGIPQTIKAQFNYERNYIEIIPDYPGFEDTGFIFPLATEEYGSLYNVSYTVEDTLITYIYTLKKGKTVNDVLDALDAYGAANGAAAPVSREDGARHTFRVFDIAMILNTTFGNIIPKIVDHQTLEVVTTDGRVLHENGTQGGDVVCWYAETYLKNPFAEDPTEATPTEVQVYSYRYKLLSQYHLSDSQLTEYDEIYEHKDENGEVDWVIVKAATEKQISSLYTSPRYYEFGNRVMDTEYGGEPFSFDMGVYIAKYDRFFDVSAHELYELNGLERVWTEMGAGRLMGDMDGNNCLEVIDALLIQRCEAGLSDYPAEDQNIPSDWVQSAIGYFSDFDQDSERTILDATAIQRYLANLQYRPAGWTPYPHNVQPTETEPTQPAPTQPAPTEPAPTQAVPTEPEPTQPAPTQSEPTETAPTEPEPTEADDPIPRITGFRSIGKGVEISLSKVKDAEKYRVYYWSKANNTWKSMGETTTNTFIDDDVTVGTTYRYTVRCIKADLSAFTSDFDHTGWTYTYDPQLDTPHITGFNALNEGIEIRWGAVDGADLYRVYREEESGWTKIGETRGTTFVDTNVRIDVSYIYTIRCLSCKGKDFASDHDWGRSFCIIYTPEITSLTVRGDSIRLTLRSFGGERSKLRIYRKGESGWQRIGELPYVKETMDMKNGYEDRYVFYDYDVQPGKTYTYTARVVFTDDNTFVSRYNTNGWSKKFSADNYDPKLAFAIYTGDSMVLVQAEDNKFGISKYLLYLYDGTGEATAEIGSDPIYLRNAMFSDFKAFSVHLDGLDKNDNKVTARHYDSVQIRMLPPHTSLNVRKTGDREYAFSWSGGYGLYSNLNLISADGEYIIDSGVIPNSVYYADFSDYPEGTEWNCIVWSCTKDGISCSLPISMEFNETS